MICFSGCGGDFVLDVDARTPEANDGGRAVEPGEGVDAGRVSQGQGMSFQVGVNYPWRVYGCDVGESAWGHLGVSAHREEVARDLALLASAGVQTIRWFWLADGRCTLFPSPDGQLMPLTERAYEDMDAIVELVDGAGLSLVPVLLDFYFFGSERVSNGVSLGGRSQWIVDADLRRQLWTRILIPILQRYGQHPAIGAWDLINEPEWAMDGFGESWLGGAVPVQSMLDFVDDGVGFVHRYTEHAVTLGSADRSWMERYWVGRGLDVLQYHYYDEMAFSDSVEDFEVPVVLGEFSTAPERTPLGDVLDAARAGGFSQAWAWSFRATDSHSALDLDALRTWTTRR